MVKHSFWDPLFVHYDTRMTTGEVPEHEGRRLCCEVCVKKKQVDFFADALSTTGLYFVISVFAIIAFGSILLTPYIDPLIH